MRRLLIISAAAVAVTVALLCVFSYIKGVPFSFLKKEEEGEAEPEMDPPTCPFCLEEVKEGATRCPHCAGAFDEPAAPTPKAEE